MRNLAIVNLYRGSFARLLELDAQIRAGRFPNCSSFAREWEISSKTVQRDIEFLRDRLGAPIAYHHGRRGYHYTDTAWSMPRLELSEGELFELAVAGRMAAQYTGTPLADALATVLDTIRASLAGPVSIDPVLVQSGFSFHGHPVREVALETWTAVARAVRDRRLLRVRYRRFGARRARDHEIEPVHLTCLDGEWTLVGRIRPYQNLVLLALSRMQTLETTTTPVPPIPFDPEAFFANRFSRFVAESGAVHRIAVRFSAAAAPGIAERRWHPDQRTERRRDGSVVLRFPAPSLYEVERWVLQWGAEAEVLEPPELREAVAAHARRMAAAY